VLLDLAAHPRHAVLSCRCILAGDAGDVVLPVRSLRLVCDHFDELIEPLLISYGQLTKAELVVRQMRDACSDTSEELPRWHLLRVDEHVLALVIRACSHGCEYEGLHALRASVENDVVVLLDAHRLLVERLPWPEERRCADAVLRVLVARVQI